MIVTVDPSAFADTAPSTLYGGNLGKNGYQDITNPTYISRLKELGLTHIRYHLYNDGAKSVRIPNFKALALAMALPSYLQVGSSPIVAGSDTARVLDPTNVVSKPDNGSFGFEGGRSPQEHVDLITDWVNAGIDLRWHENVNEPGRPAPVGWWSYSGAAFEWASMIHRKYRNAVKTAFPAIKSAAIVATSQFSLPPWVNRGIGVGTFSAPGGWPYADSNIDYLDALHFHQYTKAGGTGRQERVNAMLFDVADEDRARLFSTTQRWRDALNANGGSTKAVGWSELGGDDALAVNGTAGQNGGWFCLYAECVAATIASRFRSQWRLELMSFHSLAPGGGGILIGGSPSFSHTVRSQGLKHVVGPYLKARRRLATTLTGLGSTPSTTMNNPIQDGIADARVSDDGNLTYVMACNLHGSSSIPLSVALGFTPTGPVSAYFVDSTFTSSTGPPPTLAPFTAGPNGTWSTTLPAFRAVLYIIPSNFGPIGSSPPPPVAPTNVVPPSITGTVGIGNTLTANPGSWQGDAPISFAYQWQRCDAAGANCTNIAGATSSTYVMTATDVDPAVTVRVQVIATNAAGSSSPAFSPVVGAPPPPPANPLANDYLDDFTDQVIDTDLHTIVEDVGMTVDETGGLFQFDVSATAPVGAATSIGSVDPRDLAIDGQHYAVEVPDPPEARLTLALELALDASNYARVEIRDRRAGKTTPGGTPANFGQNFKVGSSFTFPAMVVSEVWAYLDGLGSGTGSQVLKAGIFDFSGGVPANLLGASAEVTITDGQAPGWVRFLFLSPVTIPSAGTYWLGLLSGAASATTRWYWDAGTGRDYENADTYSDGFTATFGTATVLDRVFSIYAVGEKELAARTVVATVETAVGSPVTYDPVAMRWLNALVSGGKLYLGYAPGPRPDPAAVADWTMFAPAGSTPPFDLEELALRTVLEASSPQVEATTVSIDNLNLRPPPSGGGGVGRVGHWAELASVDVSVPDEPPIFVSRIGHWAEPLDVWPAITPQQDPGDPLPALPPKSVPSKQIALLRRPAPPGYWQSEEW